MTESHEPLSPAGEQRREAILQLARGAARSRRTQRRRLRAGAGALLILAVAGLGVYVTRPATSERPAWLVSTPAPPTSHPATAPQPALFASIETDPAIVRRLALPPEPPRWASISDDELIASLSQSGRSAGLIEVAGTKILIADATAAPRR
jgi:hypothetical protein